MANLKLLTDNVADAATLSGGSWQATLPLPNLQQPALARVARSNSAAEANTFIDIDLGATPAVVRCLGFVRHNLSQDATVTITAGTFPGASDKYVAGLAAWPRVYSYADLAYGHPNWWNGRVGAAEAAQYPMKFIHDTGVNLLARYWRIQISDVSNAAGYVQMARLFMGALWSTAVNYSPGASLGWQPNTREERSLAGALYFDEKPSMRVFDFSVDGLTDAEAYGRILDLQRTHGISGELLVIPDSDDGTRRHRRDIWGRMRRFDPIANFALGLHRMGITVEEFL
jgi:hypothetical protein